MEKELKKLLRDLNNGNVNHMKKRELIKLGTHLGRGQNLGVLESNSQYDIEQSAIKNWVNGNKTQITKNELIKIVKTLN